MSGCPVDHTSRAIGARCSLCDTPLFRDLRATLHRKGTPDYQRHVQAEQQGMIDHLQELIGRPLTDLELAQTNDAVAEAIARFSR